MVYGRPTLLEVTSRIKFETNPYVGPSFQLLGILKYASGLKRGPALILAPNFTLEITSKNTDT